MYDRAPVAPLPIGHPRMAVFYLQVLEVGAVGARVVP